MRTHDRHDCAVPAQVATSAAAAADNVDGTCIDGTSADNDNADGLSCTATASTLVAPTADDAKLAAGGDGDDKGVWSAGDGASRVCVEVELNASSDSLCRNEWICKCVSTTRTASAPKR